MHARHGRDRHSTLREHMPSAHRQHAEWTPSRILSWAGRPGPSTRALCGAILADRPHPEQGYRSCLGILRLAKKYGDARVESVLRLGLDSQPMVDVQASQAPVDHENVRGPDYFVN